MNIPRKSQRVRAAMTAVDGLDGDWHGRWHEHRWTCGIDASFRARGHDAEALVLDVLVFRNDDNAGVWIVPFENADELEVRVLDRATVAVRRQPRERG